MDNANGRNGIAATAPLERWSGRLWSNQLVALRFVSVEELDEAIDWLWSDPELRHLPRVHVGKRTMAVPISAADHFQQRGFKFEPVPTTPAGDLSAEKMNRIRRSH
ncbi:MAG: hypothetical protein U0793_12365 [Gemmataceae bacterium]